MRCDGGRGDEDQEHPRLRMRSPLLAATREKRSLARSRLRESRQEGCFRPTSSWRPGLGLVPFRRRGRAGVSRRPELAEDFAGVDDTARLYVNARCCEGAMQCCTILIVEPVTGVQG